MVGRDLESTNSLSIKKPKHFFLKLSTSINYYSLKDSMSIDNVFLDKRYNYLYFLIYNSLSFNLATYIILGYY